MELIYREQFLEQEYKDYIEFEMATDNLYSAYPLYFQTVIKNNRRTRPVPSRIKYEEF